MHGPQIDGFAAAGPMNDGPIQGLVNLEAEGLVIGSLLRNNDWVDDVVEKLSPDDFCDPLLAAAYQLICEGAAAGRGASAVTIGPRLREAFPDRDVGGLIASLPVDPLAGIRPGPLARDIADLASRRRFVHGIEQSRALAFDLNTDIAQVAVAVDENVAGALRQTGSRPSMLLADAWRSAVHKIRQLRAGAIAPGVRFVGLSDIEDITGGIRPGYFVLLGGRPSMGKTALSLGMARRAAEAGDGVLFISREMDTPELMPRMVADLMFEAGSPVTFKQILKGEVSDADLALMAEVEQRIEHWPLVIDDPTHLNAASIASLVRRHQRAFAARGQTLKLVIIDYLGLLDPPPGRQSRNEEVTAISQAIKNAARSCGVAIVALTQLSRAVEQRDDKRPVLPDLRDSGSLEQDADIVLFVYRDEYYLGRAEPSQSDKRYEQWAMDMTAARDRLEVYSAKVRQGAIGKKTGYFFGSRQAVRNSDYYMSGY
jgi:replicative DNA helicase